MVLLAALVLWQIGQQPSETEPYVPRKPAPSRPGADARWEAQIAYAQMERETAVQKVQRRWDVSDFSYAAAVWDGAIAHGVSPDLMFSLVWTESAWDPTAVSYVGAIGLCQIMLGTAQELRAGTTTTDLFDPAINANLGAQYMSLLLKEYDGDRRLALLAYNRGPNRVRYLVRLGIDPANGYAEQILRRLD